MRVFLSILFLLFTSVNFASAYQCPNGTDTPTECNIDTTDGYGTQCQGSNNCSDDVPGKYCKQVGPTYSSTVCPEGAYCPGNGYAYCCAKISGTNGAFPNSAQRNENNTTIGAKSKYECYREVSCTKSNGTDTESNCREYYRDGTGNNTTINLNGTNYTYKGNAAHHWVSCPDTNNQYDIGEGSDNTLDSAGYHMENTNTECYANTLACSKFNSTQGGNNIQCVYDENQLADYNSNDHLWTFTNCLSCKTTGTATQYGTYLCEANWVEYGRASSAAPTSQSVNSAILTFSSTPNDWNCTGCKEGYIGFFKYSSASHNNQKKCMPAVNGCYSDGCALDTDSPCFNGTSTNNQPIVFPIPQYYPDQFMCDNIVSSYSYYWDTLKKFYHSCYAGMTTNNTGSTTRNDCHYTDATKFCDAYGCVGMDQLLQNTGTSQNDWTWYMQ